MTQLKLSRLPLQRYVSPLKDLAVHPLTSNVFHVHGAVFVFVFSNIANAYLLLDFVKKRSARNSNTCLSYVSNDHWLKRTRDDTCTLLAYHYSMHTGMRSLKFPRKPSGASHIEGPSVD